MILVSYDGFTDNTKDIVNTYIRKYPDKIRYIWQENKGLAIVRNTGIAQSKGEYIALLDADDKWLPNRLEEGVRLLDADPSIGLVHGHVTEIDINNKEIGTSIRNPQPLSGSIFENIFLRKADIVCPTVLFRRTCCEKVGMFDENLSRLGCEDRDLWLRIAQKYKIVYINKVLAYYRVSSQSMSKNIENMTKARLYVIDKYCPENDQSKHHLRNKAIATF